MNVMKKSLMISVLILVVFLTGCLDYQAYDTSEETDLVDEIAQIEEELALEEEANGDVIEDIAEDESVVEEDIELELEALEEDMDVVEGIEEGDSVDEAEDGIQVIKVDENQLMKLNVILQDRDGDQVRHSFTPPLDAQGKWQTHYGDAGEYLVTLSATDGKLTTEKKIRIVVNRVNVPPVITGVKDLRTKEGGTVRFEPQVSDPNGDPVSVTISEPLKSGTFVTDHTSSGEYSISVVASDGELSTEKTFSLIIQDVNVLPVVTGVRDLIVKEGEIIKIEPVVEDLDGDLVTITISEPVGDDGVWETSYTNHGEYVITVTADDGKDIVTERVRVVIEDVNVAPEIIDVSLAVN